MAKQALPSEVRQARAYLVQRGISPAKVQPRKFANAAKETGVSFKQLLLLLGKVLDQGQGGAERDARRIDALSTQPGELS